MIDIDIRYQILDIDIDIRYQILDIRYQLLDIDTDIDIDINIQLYTMMNQNRGFEHGQLEKKRFFHTWNVGTTPSRCTSILDQPI